MMREKMNNSLITEENVSQLLQRYNPTVVLALLHEVFQVAGPKIDWNALVKRTVTGITSAREYQMLWRHLAYYHTMEEKLEDGAEPLGDDSDLEFELEISHGANDGAMNEAAACVQALISSNLQRESGQTIRASVGALLASNITNDQTSCFPVDKQQISSRGSNISIPISGQKHPLPRVQSAEGLDGTGATGSDLPFKKKRKLWTKEEDLELIAAVQKFGEGNWATIVKGEFKHDRTASQLSQRWAIIRKRDGNLLAGSGNKSAIPIIQTEERLATQKAIFLALGNPRSGRMVTTLSVPGSDPQSLNQLPQPSTPGLSQNLMLNQMNKARRTTQKPMMQVTPPLGPNPSIKAAAFAAGGRIAEPSTAASLLKAAQSMNVVHIKPGGAVRTSSQTTSVTSPQSTNTAENNHIIQPAPPVIVPASASSLTASGSLRNGTHQSQGLAGIPAISAEKFSAETTQQVPLESSTVESSAIVSPSDMDELLIVEAKSSDELEFDDIVSQ